MGRQSRTRQTRMRLTTTICEVTERQSEHDRPKWGKNPNNSKKIIRVSLAFHAKPAHDPLDACDQNRWTSSRNPTRAYGIFSVDWVNIASSLRTPRFGGSKAKVEKYTVLVVIVELGGRRYSLEYKSSFPWI